MNKKKKTYGQSIPQSSKNDKNRDKVKYQNKITELFNTLREKSSNKKRVKKIYEEEKNPYNPNCKKCGGTGVIETEINGIRYVKDCDCRKEEILKRKLKNHNIPKEYWDKTISDLTEQLMVNAIMGEKVEELNINKFLNWYINNLDKMLVKKKNLLLKGGNGSGKTMMACIIAKKALKQGYSAEYIHEKRLLRLSGSLYNDEKKQKKYDKLKNTDFLILDEYGKKHDSNSGWSYTEIEDFLDYRLAEENKVTIITTNLNDIFEVKESNEKIEMHKKSLRSRIGGKMMVLNVLIDKDYRKKLAEKMWEDINVDKFKENKD